MIKTFISKWSESVVKYRWLMIIGVLIIITASFAPMKNLYFDNSNEIFFLPNDPTLTTYDLFLDRFGDSEYLSIAVETREGDKNVFTHDTLQVISKLTRFLEEHEFVTKVSSLTKYQYIHSKDDTLNSEYLIEDQDDIPKTSKELAKLELIMEKETLVLDSLITKDFKHTVVLARTLHIKNDNTHNVKLINDLQAFLIKEKFKENGFNLHIFGDALIAERFQTVTSQDQSKLFPIMCVIIWILLFVSFRSFLGVILPWLIIISAVITVVGIMGFLKWPFNTINMGLLTIIIILGIGDSVHILVEFYHFRNLGNNSKKSAILGLESIWLPCFYTSFTTAIGFFTLTTTKLQPIRELGILGGLGSLIAFLFSVTILPALLSFTKSIPEKTKKMVTDGFIAQFTHKLVPFAYNNYKILSFLGGIVMLVSVIFSFQISVDTNYVEFFRKKTAIRKDLKYFDNTFGGVQNIEVMVDSGKEGGVKEPDFLNEVSKLQTYLTNLPDTGSRPFSILDYIKKMNQSMHNDDLDFFVIPETRNLIAQYLLLYENTGPEEDLTDLKTIDERYMRISISVKNMSAKKTNLLLNNIRDTIKNDFSNLSVELTGGMILFTAMDIHILDGITKSFSLAILLITLCFFVLFKSIKYGFLALIPSVFPIVFSGGLMYLAGISLNLGTMIIAAMTIGIAVDDTIHIMNRYIQNRRLGKDNKESLHLSMIESGRAVIFTSIILISGFSINIFGSFIPTIYTGIFAAIIMFVALIADLVLLPAIIFLARNKKEITT